MGFGGSTVSDKLQDVNGGILGAHEFANAVAFKKKQLEQRCTCSTLDIQDGLCASVVN